MKELFKGENLVLEYDQGPEGDSSRLFLGQDGGQWYVLSLHKAKALRDALNEGIEKMERDNEST